MSIPVGQVVETILDYTNRSSEKAIQEKVWRILNVQYFELCARWPWHKLRRQSSIDFTADTTTTGLWLPSNLMGIERVRDNDDDFEFLPRDRCDAYEADDQGYRYFTKQGSTTPLASGTDLILSKEATTFTADTLAVDHTGYYIRFGHQLGYYLLSAIKTFGPAYNGPKLASEDWVIRDKDTQKLVILDPAEDELTDRTVLVHYWEAPEPLYKDSDSIVLPISRPLELATLRALPEAKDRRPVSESELKEAIEEALKLNPDHPRSSKPRDRNNNPYDMSQPLYSSR